MNYKCHLKPTFVNISLVPASCGSKHLWAWLVTSTSIPPSTMLHNPHLQPLSCPEKQKKLRNLFLTYKQVWANFVSSERQKVLALDLKYQFELIDYLFHMPYQYFLFPVNNMQQQLTGSSKMPKPPVRQSMPSASHSECIIKIRNSFRFTSNQSIQLLNALNCIFH